MDPNIEAPFFSVITPAYNAERHIENAIQSVVGQTFDDWEMIVVNDGSNDRTKQIVEAWCHRDLRIKLINQPNLRQGAARNTGINSAKGKWIAFLDADDIWLCNKLSRQFNILNEHQSADIIYCDGYTKYDHTPFNVPYHLKKIFGLIDGQKMYQLLVFDNRIPLLSAIVNKKLFQTVGFFDESSEASGCEDHDLWLRAAKAGVQFLGSPEKCFIYHIHDKNFSSDYIHQNFSSAYIRLKNFDKGLLTDDQIKKFAFEITQVVKLLNKDKESALEDELRQQQARLGLKNGYFLPASEILKWLKFNTKVTLIKLLKYTYFPIKKRVSNFNNRTASEYQKWLHHELLILDGNLRLSSSAKIDFFKKKGKIHSYGMQLGDYSAINMVTERAELITGAEVSINKFCNFNILGRVILGNNVLFNNYSSLNCFEEIQIGDDTWLGEGVRLYDHNHQYKNINVPFTSQGYSTGPIKIGRNVWIGSNTIILQNVTIGDNCVIGANNIIFKSVPKDTIIKSGTSERINRGKFTE